MMRVFSMLLLLVTFSWCDEPRQVSCGDSPPSDASFFTIEECTVNETPPCSWRCTHDHVHVFDKPRECSPPIDPRAPFFLLRDGRLLDPRNGR